MPELKKKKARSADLSFGVMPTQRKTLSVAMIAMNEEANLPRTLESVKWADEIVVVDSGSRDRTIEIAQSFGAKTSYHAFGGHGEQKNVALDLCTSDWILLLDADEVLTPELQAEIRDLLAGDPQFEAYWIPRLNLYFGKWIRHGGFYPDRKLRLFKRGAARLSEGVGPHSTPQFTGPRGKLRGRYAALRLSDGGHLSRTHEPLQLGDCGTAAQARQGQQGAVAVFVECGAESDSDVHLQLFLSAGISGWARGIDSAHQPLGVYPLEVHQGVAAGAGERVTSSQFVSSQFTVLARRLTDELTTLN